MKPFAEFTDRTWRYAPSSVIIAGHGEQPVTSFVFHPINSHPSRCPIRADMNVLELVTPRGSRFYGCESARINSELRMIVIGGFVLDEVRMSWEIAKEVSAE